MNVPKLRFKEFEGEWERYSLGENADIKGRVGWKSLKQDEYTNEGPNMIAGKHITKGTIKWEAVDHIPQWRYEESPEIMLENGDVIFTKDGSLGNPAIIRELPGESTINSTMMLVRTGNKIDSEFFYQILLGPQFKRLIYLKVSGSSIPHLFQADMKEFSFFAPLIKEQKRISKFLNILDKKVQLQQQKINLLQKQKKVFLQKMFPKAGETKPEIRYDEFTGDWEKYKLGDLGSFKNGMNFGKEAMGHGYPFVNLQNIFGKNVVSREGLGLAESNEKQLQEYNLLKGDVLFIRSSVKPEGVGEAALIPYDFINTTYSGFIIRFRPSVKIEDNFKRIMFATRYVRNQIMTRSTSSANTNINQDSLEKIEVFLPTIEEQCKISNLFNTLEKSIVLQQQKLELLQKQKQAFMQQMFI